MFINILKYKKPMKAVELHLEAHRAFLDAGYEQGVFLLSGPMNPRTGGVIISMVDTEHENKCLLEGDPFWIHDVASYDIINFIPNKHHPLLKAIFA